MYIFSGRGNTVSVNKREKNNYLSSPFLSGSSAKAQVGRIFVKISIILVHSIFLDIGFPFYHKDPYITMPHLKPLGGRHIIPRTL